MNHIKIKLSIICVVVFSNHGIADTLDLSYRHDYLSRNRFHTDKLALDYFFNSGIKIGVGANLFGKARDHFDNPSLHSTFLRAYYKYGLIDEITIVPHMEIMFYSGTNPNSSNLPSKADWSGEISDNGTSGVKYNPGLTLTYSPSKRTRVLIDYQYNLRKLSRYYRDIISQPKYGGHDHNEHRFMIGLDINASSNIDFSYDIKYIKGNYDLYNNKKYNYEQSLILMYRLNRNWRPFIQVQDKASSTTNDLREAVIGSGFHYYF